ncbi:glycosylation-dependent cell adhesion molecule 1 isoform X2 [Camelus bactrianus]|uniref:Glycosylation-dependent cell adhesion molecule 1 isoform X2 n=2 Tax=Camelus bactrianus TaxID=9837 RepID=A0AC58R8F2_CAMBA|nr:glycosylation-dependent cell adhesion molecule 1 isoform X2 [Camelus bactrianus]
MSPGPTMNQVPRAHPYPEINKAPAKRPPRNTKQSPQENRSCSSPTMKFFAVLLLASLTSASLASLNAAQVIMSNHQVSSEDLSMEPSISREDLVSKDDVVIKSARRHQNQNPKLLHPVPQESSFRNTATQSEETKELTPGAATTLEGKLVELTHKIIKNLENTMRETMDFLKSLFPHASEVVKPQ